MIPNRKVAGVIAIADWRLPVLTIIAVLAFGASPALCAENDHSKQSIHDTVVSWEPWYDPGSNLKPNVPYYVDGWFVGFGADGFNAAIERVSRLPSGTSVVWGPDGSKFLSGPGDTVARDLFPELWRQFQKTAKERGLALSSFGYGRYIHNDVGVPQLPVASYVERGDSAKEGDVVFAWRPGKGEDSLNYSAWNFKEWPVYSLDGRESGRGRDGFFTALKTLRNYPDGSRLRIVWCDSKKTSYASEPPGIEMFNLDFRRLVAAKRFQLVVECNKKDRPKNANCPNRCRFEWRYIRSGAPTVEDVVYLIDGKVAGIGNAGFDAVLKHLRQLPQGACVEYPKYHLHAKAYRPPERKAFESKDPVPFGSRRKELNDLVKKMRFVVDRDNILYWPKPKCDGRVDEGYETDWFLQSLLHFVTIVRDGAKPAKADATITWTQEHNEYQHPLGEAAYCYDGRPIGVGTDGFLAALKRLESLPNGATVRIDPVCIRTHAPFAEPCVVKGQRHFETTGEEPFRGMVDLLGDLTRRKRFHVEVIPDEGKPYRLPGG